MGRKMRAPNEQPHMIDFPDRVEYRLDDGGDGKLHREDGPAVEMKDGSGKSWWINGELHRVGGPAVELEDGTKYWFLNGERHRMDGPAVEKADGTKEWWVLGKAHREDGPAFINPDGTRHWYINNKRLSPEEENYRNAENEIGAFTATNQAMLKTKYTDSEGRERSTYAPAVSKRIGAFLDMKNKLDEKKKFEENSNKEDFLTQIINRHSNSRQ